jgi:hypothetical protein
MSDAGRAELVSAVARLVTRVSHWTPSRWAASGHSGRARAEVVYALVQQVADRAADAEGQPRRVVPRLDNDLALPDQLRVVTADLLAAGRPAGLAAAAALVTAAHRAL